MSILKGVVGLFRPLPTLFDVCVGLSLLISIFDRTHERNIFFVFYSIFLWCLTMAQEPKRTYKNHALTLFTLWAFAMLFVHSFIIIPDSVTFRYINFSILSEGFLYIFAGVLFTFTIVRYSTNLKPLLLLTLIPWISEWVIIGRVRATLVFAIGFSALVYCLYKKKTILYSLILTFGAYVFITFNARILSCLSTRPLIWGKLWADIVSHPFVGTGFNKTLNPDHMIYVPEGLNWWILRHNDFMSIGAYLGIPAIVFIVWFAISLLKKTRLTIWFIPIMSLILLCTFQMTMFEAAKAMSCLLIIGITVINTEDKDEKVSIKFNSRNICM